MTIFESKGLSSSAIEMLGQLYVSGPTWDGNVCSKQGRGELCRAGLAWDGEIAALRRKKPPRILDKNAKDMFQRPV